MTRTFTYLFEAGCRSMSDIVLHYDGLLSLSDIPSLRYQRSTSLVRVFPQLKKVPLGVRTSLYTQQKYFNNNVLGFM